MTDSAPDWWQPHLAAFPRWHAWLGVNGMYYAPLPFSSPPVVLSDKDPAGLADQVRLAEEDRAPWWQAP